MTEKQLQQEILKEVGSHPDFRLFRNNVGNGWMGEYCGDVGGGKLLLNARRVQFGLCQGSGDLIGLQKVKITPEMVGQEIARFVSIEVKSEKGKLTDDQKAWLEMVNRFGGLGVVMRSVDEVKGMVT